MEKCNENGWCQLSFIITFILTHQLFITFTIYNDNNYNYIMILSRSVQMPTKRGVYNIGIYIS